MHSVFPSEFFRANREQLLKQAGVDIVVIASNGLLQRSGDTTFPFRQNSNFWYLCGIDEPDCVLVIEPKVTWLIVAKREAIRETFDGTVDKTEVMKASGIAKVVTADTGWTDLQKKLKQAKKVGTVIPLAHYIERAGFYTNPAPAGVVRRLKEHVPDKKLVDILPTLIEQRMIKQDLELVVMQHAIDITAETLREVLPRAYKHEYELEAAITEGFRRRGAAGHAYDPIVASGSNACTIHYEANNDPIDKQGLLLVDVGAEVSHYAADITRTVAPVIANNRQQAVFDAVLETQTWTLQQIKPGLTLKDLEKKVEGYMGDQLKKLKLITKKDKAIIRKFYPHSVSHSLGLDVHDAFNYDTPLKAGMVITIEPGIYIPKEGIGVRIEDDVLITKDGYKVLSDDLPRTLA